MDIRLHSPEYLFLLLAVPALALFYVWAFRAKRKALERFGRIETLARLMPAVSRGRQIGKCSLLLGGFALLGLSLARPQWGTTMDTLKREGLDIIVALDTSPSMLAEDVKPSRIMEAKRKLGQMIQQLQGDRIGLVAFAGIAFVQCPLTLDYGAAKMFLDTINVGIIPEDGTNIAAAIRMAQEAFVKTERKHKVLILLTDGENLSGEPQKAAEEAAEQGVKIYAIGLGSPQGEPVPLFDENGNRKGFLKDDQGNVDLSKLDEYNMQKLAYATGGSYYRASAEGIEIGKIFDDIQSMEKKELSSRKYLQYEERFQYFLFPAVLLILLEGVISERRRLEHREGRFE